MFMACIMLIGNTIYADGINLGQGVQVAQVIYPLHIIVTCFAEGCPSLSYKAVLLNGSKFSSFLP